MNEQRSDKQKADPAIYPKLRDNALKLRLPNLPGYAVHVVLMDWHVTLGTVTVLAAVDGTGYIAMARA